MSSSPAKSRLPLLVALVLMVATGAYGFLQYTALSDVKADVLEADDILLELETELGDAQKNYETSRKAFLTTFSSNIEKLSQVLPEDERLSELTRALDDFALKNHYKNNPFFISQLSYGDVDYPQGKDYGVLSMNISLVTSEKNFYKFLEYIETSGSIENGTRLMSVQSISLQLNREKNTGLNLQLSLLAYLQNHSSP